MNHKGYYDIDDLEDAIEGRCNVDELFYIKDLKQRKLFLNGEIDRISVSGIIRHILQYNADDADIEPSRRRPIYLYMTSEGGDIADGFMLIDVIEASQTPVYTINFGYWYSMSLLIGIAGHKRYASKNATYLIHDGSGGAYGSQAKVGDHIEFMHKIADRVRQYIISHSSITPEEYDANRRVEWYLFSNEAKEKGLIDAIIGEDCEISDVV